MIDPAVILTLLDPGPLSRDELAIALSAPTDLLKHELTRLVRAGHLKRTGGTKNYALASYVAKRGRPAIPGRQRRGAGQRLLCATCLRNQAKRDGLCRGCFTAAGFEWTESPRAGTRHDVESRASRCVVAGPLQHAPPRPPVVLRSIVDQGIEYQVIDYEALLERSAPDYPSKASSLAAPFFDRPRFGSGRNDLRRGAHS